MPLTCSQTSWTTGSDSDAESWIPSESIGDSELSDEGSEGSLDCPASPLSGYVLVKASTLARLHQVAMKVEVMDDLRSTYDSGVTVLPSEHKVRVVKELWDVVEELKEGGKRFKEDPSVGARAVQEADKVVVEVVESTAIEPPKGPSPYVEKPITKAELAKREAIASNIVLFGAASTPSSSPAELLALSLLPPSTDSPAPLLVVRRPSKRTTPSPLVLTFANQADRASYLFALKTIPNSPLSARHDLTPFQQERRRFLVEQARKEGSIPGWRSLVRGDRVALMNVGNESGPA